MRVTSKYLLITLFVIERKDLRIERFFLERRRAKTCQRGILNSFCKESEPKNDRLVIKRIAIRRIRGVSPTNSGLTRFFDTRVF